MTTFEHSAQIDWLATESESTSFAADSRAKIYRSPERVLVLQARGVDSGANTSDSFARFDPATSSWRTCQACLVEGYQRFSETWPRSFMTRKGTAYRLPTLVPLTGETESGLLPTPAASYYGSNQGGSAGRTGPVRLGLETMARKGLWPTPTAKLGDPRRGSPSAQTAQKRFSQGKRNLDDSVAMWPTPTVGDSKSSGSRNTPSSKAHPGVSLTDAVRGDGGAGRTWPTPAARDYRHPNALPYSERGGGTKGEQLPNAVGGSLNPQFVEWLMGFPKDWTVIFGWKNGKASRALRKVSPTASTDSKPSEMP